ncbi:MAG TPA: pyridoxamine 5'-phosphate oxidase family protein [Dehalococcoidia bacterium]|jgi:general stress protein 26|nr:pyridoxamine 5'-phosphate oxidase family protein [Dehalococcoidia bacterium]
MNKRLEAAEAYVRAMRTGEFPAVAEASKVLAKDVKLTGATVWGRQGATVEGHDDVLYRITGVWPNTPVYVRGYWSGAYADGDTVKVDATFPGMGAAPAEVHLTFHYNGSDEISQVDQQIVPQPRPEASDTIPANARGTINGALANNTPMCISYVDENGMPNMSMRGSVQVYSDTQLSIWVRNKEGGMVKALAKNPYIGLLYRDNATRSTLIVQGKGHVETDPEIVERVWNGIQDVEQKHETREPGCALIIDVIKMQGGTPRGGVRVERSE